LLGGLDIPAISGGPYPQKSTISIFFGNRDNINCYTMGKTRSTYAVAICEVARLGGKGGGSVPWTNLEGVVLSDHWPNKFAHFTEEGQSKKRKNNAVELNTCHKYEQKGTHNAGREEERAGT
jgi:hypothetical protein